MSFTGKYELETQENYDEFLEALDLPKAKTDYQLIAEIDQDGNNFTWTQSSTNHTWTNTFTTGQECELSTMTGVKFKAPVIMENGQIKIPFPRYHFTVEMVDDKLVMTCVTPGEKGVMTKHVLRRTRDVVEKEA